MRIDRKRTTLAFIRNQQNKEGGFNSLSIWPNGSSETSLNTFTTSLILNCIAEDTSRDASRIGAKGAAFILKQRSRHWSWNYWQRGEGNKANETPCPDDMDDTSMALSALALHDPKSITGEALACATRLLTATENRIGGPYHTWIANRQKDPLWNDVDIVVNSNIALFLSSQGITLPNLVAFAEDTILSGKFESKYYSPLAIAYFISRWYKGPLAQELEKFVVGLRKRDGGWGDMLSTAMGISTLANLGAHHDTYAKAVVTLESTREWRPLPFYIEAIKKGRPVCGGSSALTAAFCFEALDKAARVKIGRSDGKNKTGDADKKALAAHEEILGRVSKNLSFFSPKITETIKKMLEKMLARDPGRQITLLPYRFAESMKGPKRPSPEQLIELGVANLYGWLAYKIYDDILDDEGDIGLLPVANTCLRMLSETYCGVLPKENRTIFNDLIHGVERANAWEREFCRIGELGKNGTTIKASRLPTYENYDVLADKSMAHALGPASIIIKTGGPSAASDLRQTLAFFKNYIIARQLNDDAHDWFPDLERGFANSVSSKILRLYFKSRASSETRSPRCNIRESKLDLEGIFWNEVADATLGEITSHIRKARKCLKAIKILRDRTYLDSLLQPLESAVYKTAIEKQKARDFIDSYNRQSM